MLPAAVVAAAPATRRRRWQRWHLRRGVDSMPQITAISTPRAAMAYNLLSTVQTPRPHPPPPPSRRSALSSRDATESRAALGPIGMEEAYAELLVAAGLRLGAMCALHGHRLCLATYTCTQNNENVHGGAAEFRVHHGGAAHSYPCPCQVRHPAARGARRSHARTARRGRCRAAGPLPATRNAARPP